MSRVWVACSTSCPPDRARVVTQLLLPGATRPEPLQ